MNLIWCGNANQGHLIFFNSLDIPNSSIGKYLRDHSPVPVVITIVIHFYSSPILFQALSEE